MCQIIERLDKLVEVYRDDIIVYLIVRKRGRKKEIVASKLLKNFVEDLEPEYVG